MSRHLTHEQMCDRMEYIVVDYEHAIVRKGKEELISSLSRESPSWSFCVSKRRVEPELTVTIVIIVGRALTRLPLGA